MTTAIRKYTDLRSWARQLAKSSIHAGTGAILSGLGTNGAEAVAPELLKGIGMDLKQMAAVFVSAAFVTALQKINQATADTVAPFSDIKDQS